MDFAQYFLGVDLGQSQDFTALAVMERAELTGEWDPVAFAYRKEVQLALRHLERVPLGTPYPEVVERIREVTEEKELRGRCQLVVDATGVGKPVVDALRRERLSCGMMPVMITAGSLERMDGGYHMVPKRDLISGLQLMLQRKELQIAKGMAGTETLVEEMMAMRVKISLAGNEQFGAWREGEHDDLVLAVALACWALRRTYPDELVGEEAYWRRVGRQPDLWDALGGKGRL
jgi:hypothetical protein